jgi:PEP-CTERM putative exosortase interaction domain
MLWLGANTLQATIVTGSFAGAFERTDSYIADGTGGSGVSFSFANAGTPVTGSFNYDTSGAVDSNPDPAFGQYIVSGSLSMFLSAVGLNYTSAGPLTVTVQNGVSFDSLTILDPNTPSPGSAQWTAQFLPTTFSSDALPENFSFGSGLTGFSYIMFGSSSSPGFPFPPAGTQIGQAYAFDTASASAVPEPSSLLLLLLAVVPCAWARRRFR